MVKRIYKEKVIEFRRVIKSGDSFVISIPKAWLDQNNLSWRDELECKISEDKIIISNKKLEY